MPSQPQNVLDPRIARGWYPRPRPRPTLTLTLTLSPLPSHPWVLPSSHTLWVTPSHRACCTLTLSRRHYPNPSPPVWPADAALSFFLTTNLSNLLFRDVLGALQGLAHAVEHIALPTLRDTFLTLAKAAFPPRGAAMLNKPPQVWQSPRSLVSLEMLTLGLAHRSGGSGSGSGAGLSPCNLACLRAFVAAAVFLTGKLGPSWFAVLDALQSADHVLTTHGTARLVRQPCVPTPVGLLVCQV